MLRRDEMQTVLKLLDAIDEREAGAASAVRARWQGAADAEADRRRDRPDA